MMGPAHALSGAAGWFIVAPAISALSPAPLTPAQVLIGAAACAGAALLPDMDHPQSTVARSFGPLTQVAAKGVNAVSAGWYNLTKTSQEPYLSDGHRKLTHTLLGTIVCAAGVGALCAFGGPWAALGVLFVLLGLAIRGLMGDWAKRQGWIAVTVTAAILAWTGSQFLPHDRSSWWLSVTVFVGTILGIAGDAETKDRVPFIAPMKIQGKAWYDIGMPAFLCIRAGGLIEKTVVMPVLGLMTLAGICAQAVGGWTVLFERTGLADLIPQLFT